MSPTGKIATPLANINTETTPQDIQPPSSPSIPENHRTNSTNNIFALSSSIHNVALDDSTEDNNCDTNEPSDKPFAMSPTIEFRPFANEIDAVDGSPIRPDAVAAVSPNKSSSLPAATTAARKSSAVALAATGNKTTTAKKATADGKNGTGSSAVLREYLKRLGDFNDSSQKKAKHSATSLSSLLILGSLLLLFVVSFIGFSVVWFTDTYNNSIISNLVLAKGTKAAEWWEVPPIDPLLRVHIFNYTNTERWLSRQDDKLIVKDLGPYVYRERYEKVDVVFNPNGTISYREKRSYEFMPELSNGKQYDSIVFPNVLLMSTNNMLEKMNMFVRTVALSLLNKHKVFKSVTADQMIWGYEDSLYDVVKQFLPNAPPLFGMLVSRAGISAETTTIHSGVNDIGKLSIIDQFDGKPSLGMWATDECNRVDGTDGSQFPPRYMNKVHPLYIFSKAFCRRFPLYFSEELNILDGIPVWRYKAPLDVFAHPDQNPSNQCFCDKASECPPSGVFDVSKCFDAPILLSFPHFFTGNQSLFTHLDGLNPTEELHRSYADIHPRLAFPIGGASRVQINVQVPPASILVAGSDRFANRQILPVIWMELSSGEISEELRATIYHSTFSTNAIELSLNYGTLLLCVTSLALLVMLWSQRGGGGRKSADEDAPTRETTALPVSTVSFAGATPVPEDVYVAVELPAKVGADVRDRDL